MKPSSFETKTRIQFDYLMRKITYNVVKNYRKELSRHANKEMSLYDIHDINAVSVMDDYCVNYDTFDVLGNEVRIYDEQLCNAIKTLTEQRRNILLMSYFLEMTDAEIAKIMSMERFSICRNRLKTLKLLKDIYKEHKNVQSNE